MRELGQLTTVFLRSLLNISFSHYHWFSSVHHHFHLLKVKWFFFWSLVFCFLFVHANTIQDFFIIWSRYKPFTAYDFPYSFLVSYFICCPACLIKAWWSFGLSYCSLEVVPQESASTPQMRSKFLFKWVWMCSEWRPCWCSRGPSDDADEDQRSSGCCWQVNMFQEP